MLIAYIDESGDTGISSLRSSATFTLGCVLIDAEDWNDEFDDLIEMRRRLRDRFKIPVRAEIKANYLVRSSGALNSVQLSPGERSLIYRAHLKQLAASGKMQAFGIVVHKSMENSGEIVLAAAWKPLLQRLERASFHSDQSPMLIIHDEGANPTIRKLARQSRRHLLAGSATGTGSLSVPFSKLVEDPFPKASHESYFLQLADLVAYAAFRRLYPPSPAISQVVPQKMWDNLGSAVRTQVNSLRPITVPGIVEVRK